MPFLRTWQIFALGSAFFAGLTAILGKLGVTGVNSNLATFVRTLVILAFITGLLQARGEWGDLKDLSQRNIVFLILSGLATGFSWLCYYHALQMGPATKVAPVDKLSVVFAILLAMLFLGEKLTVKMALGSLFIVSGSLLMLLP